MIVLGSIFVAAAIAAGAIFGAKIFDGSKNDKFALNLSSEELSKRTDKQYLIDINLLDEKSPEYQNLKDGDKQSAEDYNKCRFFIGGYGYIIDASNLDDIKIERIKL